MIGDSLKSYINDLKAEKKKHLIVIAEQQKLIAKIDIKISDLKKSVMRKK